jgi:hypothetical protein
MKNELSKIKGLSAEEQAVLAKMRAGAKIIVAPEKKSSYNQLLIEYFKDRALKRETGALKNIKNFIKNMKEVSRPDKWNYVALLHIFIKNIDINEFSALKSALNEKSALESWPDLGEVWDKKVKNAISTESR